MAFPADSLDVAVELLVDDVWTDVTEHAFTRDPIAVTRGRSAEGSQVERSTCAVTVNNVDGRYSPRNPSSPYFGLIGRNTPIRVSVPGTGVFLSLPGEHDETASTPDSAALSITGDMDVRLDVEPAGGWRQQMNLAGKWLEAGDERSWELFVLSTGALRFRWSDDGTDAGVEEVSSLPVPDSRDRLAVRVVLDVDNGASGRVARFYTAAHMGAGWTQLGDDAVGVGTTSIFDSTAGLLVGDTHAAAAFDAMTGNVYAFRLLDGIAGDLVADPDFTAQTVNDTEFDDAAGNTWTVAAEAVISATSRDYRFTGEVAAWPQHWNKPGTDVWVPIDAAGIMRRLGQGNAPQVSTVRRALMSAAQHAPLAYWPCEDSEAATSAASPIPGVGPMAVTGTVNPAASTAWPASAPLPTLASGGLRGNVPLYASTGETIARTFVAIPDGGATDNQEILSLSTAGGSEALWEVVYGTGGELTLVVTAAGVGGGVFSSPPFAADIDGTSFLLSLELEQDGADVNWTIRVVFLNDDGSTTTVTDSDTLTTSTVGLVRQVAAGRGNGLSGVTVGHVVVGDQLDMFDDTSGAITGYAGETAGRRVERLCAENGIPFTAVGDLDDTAATGPQTPQTLLDLAREAAAVDLGILYEPRDSLGLAYRTRTSLYNQDPALVLDYTAGVFAALPEPVDDDRNTRNDVTAKRTGGSEARAVREEGPLSVLDPPAGVGTYDTSVTVNTAGDGFLPDLASWLLALGTVDEARYPRLSLPLHVEAYTTGGAALSADAAALDLGDLLRVTGLPAWLPPDDVDAIAQGFTETLDTHLWTVEVTTAPASPYRVGVYQAAPGDGGDRDRYDTAGSELDAGIDDDQVTIDVAVTVLPLWTTDDAETPFDIAVGGERMTVTDIATAVADVHEFTVTRSVNGVVKAHDAGTAVSLWAPARYAL